MKYQGFLQFYKICLQLYPAEFRDRYAEQMYLTAADMLQDGWGMHGVARLLGDTSTGLVTEHIKQIGENRMKKQLKAAAAVSGAAWMGLKIVAMLLMTYVSAQPFIGIHVAMYRQPWVYSADSLLTGLLPLALTAITFWLLGVWHLGRLNRLFSSFAIGCVSASAFYWFGGTAAMRLWFWLPWRSFGATHVVYDAIMMCLYLAVFYLVGTRLVGRLAIKPKPAQRSAA